MGEIFPDFNGPHGCVHLRIYISVVVLKDGGYLSPHGIIIFRNQNKYCAKSTKKEMKFLEQLQKVLNYSRTFEEKLYVPFLGAIILYIV